MAERKKKSDLVCVCEALANLDAIDETFPGGAAYKAAMIEKHCVVLLDIARAMLVAK